MMSYWLAMTSISATRARFVGTLREPEHSTKRRATSQQHTLCPSCQGAMGALYSRADTSGIWWKRRSDCAGRNCCSREDLSVVRESELPRMVGVLRGKRV